MHISTTELEDKKLKLLNNDINDKLYTFSSNIQLNGYFQRPYLWLIIHLMSHIIGTYTTIPNIR